MDSIKRLTQQAHQIAYCLGASNYTWIHFQDGKKELVAKNISRLESQLPGFIRVHKTVLVNARCITSAYQLIYKKGEGEVQLETGDTFPVSRRRWTALDSYLRNPPVDTTTASPVTTTQVSLPEPPVALPEPPTLAILLVTDDPQKTDRAQQLIQKKWANYGLQTIQSRLLLAAIQSPVSALVSPVLILLDAQTQKVERMNALRLLKEASPLSHIPVVVFVSPVDQFVIEGYHHQANSVVAIPDNSLVFERHLERILHFWLRVAALPSLAE